MQSQQHGTSNADRLPTALPACLPTCPQVLNKARALEMLKAKLLVVAQEQQLQEIAQIRGDLVKAGARAALPWPCMSTSVCPSTQLHD